MLVKTWGDKSVVYHPASGNTHLLNSLHASILQRLTEGVDQQVIIDELSEDYGSEAVALLENAILTFKQHNLI